ncbi:MAG: hypothetical protein LQ352_000292 [Teloschistes flavicans]|nr:MAG: hypothetical protein LQ352_000292 [Teloschistes flavicans]
MLIAVGSQCFDGSQLNALRSLIICLNGLLPLSYHYESERAKGHPQSRSQPELDALELLDYFLDRYGVRFALRCNIVSLWLAKYPFGGDLESRYPSSQASRLAAKRRHISNLKTGRDKDRPMASIVKLIMSDPDGQESISDAMFSGDSFFDGPGLDEDENDDDIAGDEYSQIWYEVHGTASTPESSLGPMMRRGQRVREESLEEQALRSRRREAMVLGEMGRPIERTDIIQRMDP